MDRIMNECAILKNTDTTPYVAFPIFSAYPELVCGFSTRLGGVSRGCFASMNLGFHRGDEEDRVFENYRRICGSMGFAPEQLIFTDQVHKTNVRRAYRADCGKGIVSERDYGEVDAHITNEPDAVLLVFGADCVPLFFYDPVKHAIGAAHAGWRGSVGGIAAKTVARMQAEFGCDPSDLLVAIGPSIGPECYEVGAEVAGEFFPVFGECRTQALKSSAAGEDDIPVLSLKRSQKRADARIPSGGDGAENGQDKYRLNLWEANRRMLLHAGVRKEHIAVSGLCTMCRQDLFFSHRASGGRRGSMAGFIMLTGKNETTKDAEGHHIL